MLDWCILWIAQLVVLLARTLVSSVPKDKVLTFDTTNTKNNSSSSLSISNANFFFTIYIRMLLLLKVYGHKC